jgi:amino acid transporter
MSTDPGAPGGPTPPGGGQPTGGGEPPPPAADPHAHLSDDERTLHRLGYAQELLRGWGGFSNFAISFTIISILAGCLTSYYLAIGWGGPIAVTWGWLLVGSFCILVSLAMGEIASTYPTAGGLYYWSSRLGSPGWGWFTGWFNLVGQIAVTASIDFGAATFISSLLNLWFDYELSKGHVFLTYTVIVALHGLINAFGPRLLARINNISAWWHMAGVLVVVVVLIVVPDHHKSLSFVFTDTENFSGFQGSNFGNPMFWVVFGIGLLMAQYTITGFDASAHMSEETRNASRSAAIGMVMSVVVSVIFGFILLVAVTFAIPGNVENAALQY